MRSLLLVGVLLFFQGSISAFDSCDNGGFWLGNTSCNCPNFWSNSNDSNEKVGCTEIECVNGGYPIQKPDGVAATPQRCACPTGYLGVHCEAVTTFIPHSNVFKQSLSPSFTLVYINLFSNYYGGLVYTQFQNALDRIIGNNIVNKWVITNQGTPNFIPTSNSDPGTYNFTKQNYFNISINMTSPWPSVQYSCYGVPFYTPMIKHIKENGIRETAITILTQHPASDNSSLAELVTLCQSFDIRINVVFSDDQTFVRCCTGQLDELRKLSKNTGGIFVTAAHNDDYGATGTIIDMVLTSHIAYEPITMSTSGTIKFSMNIPPDNKKYYIVAYGNGTVSVTSSTCQVNDSIAMISGDNVYAYPVAFNAASPTCNVQFTNTNLVQVFGSNMAIGPVSVKLYKSYLPSKNLDTSKIQPVKGADHYVSIHVENTGSLGAPTLNSVVFIQNGTTNNLTMSKRNSAMEYVSNETINCDPSNYPIWIELTLKGTGLAEQRYIPVFCQEWSSGSVSSGMNYKERKLWNAEESQDGMTTTPTVDPTVFQKTFVLGYSDLTTIDQQNSFLLGSVLPGPFTPYTDFGEIRFDVNDAVPGEPAYHNQSTFIAFSDSVYGIYEWNQSYQTKIPTDSQVMRALGLLANDTRIKQNSLIAMNLARVADSAATVDTVYPLVNKNIKVVMFIDKSTLDRQNTAFSPAILNQVAAITSGHFIVCDENDDTGFQNLLKTVFTQGPGQNLLLAKNLLGVTPTGPLGTLYLGNVQGNITVTLTFTTNVYNSSAIVPIFPPATFRFVYSDGTDTYAILNQTQKSNFYSQTIELQGGSDVKLNLVQPIFYTQPSLLRVWTPYTSANNDVQIKYKDLWDNDLGGGPDDFNGVIPEVSLNIADIGTNSTLNVTYVDCAGNYIDIYDGKQSLLVTSSSSSLRYVPYFCSTDKNSSCLPGTENLYYSQYRASNGFVATKTFICAKTDYPTEHGCDNKDTRGNYFCGGSQSPYRRGRAGLLIDCSNPFDSLLSYNSTVSDTYGAAPFKCNCEGQGPSCEESECTNTNTVGGAVDTFYRTYSVVVAVSCGMTSVTDSQRLFVDAHALLVPNIPASNIWQYQLFAACPNGDITTLFIGTSFDLFQGSFKISSQLCSDCSDCPDDNATDYELTNVYNRVVSSVGRQQRGLIVFYHEMDRSVSQNVTVTNMEDFITQAQQYQQQMYVFNVFDSSDSSPSPISSTLVPALMSTGGNVVFGDYQAFNAPTYLPIMFFKTILTASVSLNALEPSNTTINTVIEIDSYLIVTKLDATPFSGKPFESICSNTTDKNAEAFGTVCIVYPQTITLPANTYKVAYSVVAINPQSSPVGIFITLRTDDQQTSVPVDYTTGGPTLAIFSPGSYDTQNNLNNNARDANRKDTCTYKRSTVDVFGRLSLGFNSIKMSTVINSTTVTKVYPFGVSHNISCQNGAFPENGTEPSQKYGKCDCGADGSWEGPDCSRPKCGNGKLSTWGNACDCPSNYAGQFCQTQLDKTTTLAPSTTAASTTVQSSTSTSNN